MNKDRLRLWVKALRSGDYRQGVEKLYNPEENAWCCLGVACDVARTVGGLPLQVEYYDGVASFDSCKEYLPNGVVEWFGLERHNPVLEGHQATEWNDEFAASFDEIADLIEAEYGLAA